MISAKFESTEGKIRVNNKGPTTLRLQWSIPLFVRRQPGPLLYQVALFNTFRYGFPTPGNSSIQVKNFTIALEEIPEVRRWTMFLEATQLEEGYSYAAKVQICVGKGERCHLGTVSDSFQTYGAGKWKKILQDIFLPGMFEVTNFLILNVSWATWWMCCLVSKF